MNRISTYRVHSLYHQSRFEPQISNSTTRKTLSFELTIFFLVTLLVELTRAHLYDLSSWYLFKC